MRIRRTGILWRRLCLAALPVLLALAGCYDETKATQKAWDIHSVPTVVLITPADLVAYRGPAVWKDLGDAAESALKLPAGTLKFGVKGTEFG